MIQGNAAAPEGAELTRLSKCLYSFMVIAIAFAAVVLFQWRNGAFHHEFISDAIGHYTTGLMLHDFLLSDSWSRPLNYAITYQEHYAFVGLGLWPPFYHAIEAVWMLAFSPSRISVMLYSATLVALLASVAGWLLLRAFGLLSAIAAVLVIVALPVMQFAANSLVVDTLVSLLALGAALSFGRFAKTNKMSDIIVFSGLAAACILTKGNGFMLALMPGLYVLLSGRWRILARWTFWFPLPLIALLVGPWYLLTYGWLSQGFLYHWGWDFTRMAVVANSQILYSNLGPAIIFSILGAIAGVRSERATGGSLWTVLTALAIACFAFQSVVPAAFEPRYLMPMLAPSIALCARGLAEVAAWIGRTRWAVAGQMKTKVRATVAALTLVLALCALPSVLHASGSPSFGVGPIVEKAIAVLPPNNPVLLMAEGPMLEADVAGEAMLRDTHRPHLVLARGTKILGGGGYRRIDYKPRFATTEAVMAQIERLGIPVVLLEVPSGAAEYKHTAQVLEAIKTYPERWQLVSQSKLPRDMELRVYRVLPNAGKPMDWPRLSAELTPSKKLGN